jgi:hypothetical protein
LTLVELKTREIDRVYESDVIELSAQRVALMETTGERVADVAYVLIQKPGTRRRVVRATKLMTAEQVSDLANRFRRLRTGAVKGTPAPAVGLCQKCAPDAVQRCLQGPMNSGGVSPTTGFKVLRTWIVVRTRRQNPHSGRSRAADASLR